MGQAKRRKLAGDYPEQKPKPRQQARIKRRHMDYIDYFPMMFTTMAAMLMRSKKPGLKQMLKEDEYE
jgi:hypothetical protein